MAMRIRHLARLALVLAVATAGLALMRPSWACGCGALITSTRSGVDVADETSIVRYDGGQEEIVMRLSVRSQARDAAWLMPTPARARVTLGESDWFDQLDRLTEVRPSYGTGGGCRASAATGRSAPRRRERVTGSGCSAYSGSARSR